MVHAPGGPTASHLVRLVIVVAVFPRLAVGAHVVHGGYRGLPPRVLHRLHLCALRSSLVRARFAGLQQLLVASSARPRATGWVGTRPTSLPFFRPLGCASSSACMHGQRPHAYRHGHGQPSVTIAPWHAYDVLACSAPPARPLEGGEVVEAAALVAEAHEAVLHLQRWRLQVSFAHAVPLEVLPARAQVNTAALNLRGLHAWESGPGLRACSPAPRAAALATCRLQAGRGWCLAERGAHALVPREAWARHTNCPATRTHCPATRRGTVMFAARGAAGFPPGACSHAPGRQGA
jgi:hypothetical protein